MPAETCRTSLFYVDRNVMDWTSAPLGVYTNPPTVKFFRLRAERVP
jgi:hypothetical protein